MASRDASSRALARIKDEMRARDISQDDLADHLGVTQPTVQRILAGKIQLLVDDLAALANRVGVPLSEVLRERGAEYYAELKPSELRVLQAYQQKAPQFRQAIQIFLGLTPYPEAALPTFPERPKKKRGRPLSSQRDK